jgi:hypothetical protein
MTKLKPLVFTDLDDTLFQTRRKMNGEEIHRQAAVAGNGDPRKSSFMTVRQSALFDWLHQTTELIPVTARSGDAFDRVDLPFNSWSILSNGALIREPGGTLHIPWADKMHALLHPFADTMQSILNEGRVAAERAGIDVRSWVVREDDLATYVVFKLNVVTDESLAALETLSLPVSGWTRHFNAETLAVIPPGSGKAAATAYLQQQLNPDNARPTLGFGDSQSDLQFMQLIDVLMVPRQSQIAANL